MDVSRAILDDILKDHPAFIRKYHLRPRPPKPWIRKRSPTRRSTVPVPSHRRRPAVFGQDFAEVRLHIKFGAACVPAVGGDPVPGANRFLGSCTFGDVFSWLSSSQDVADGAFAEISYGA